MRHLRQAGLCSRGARQYAAEHGYDWDRFLNEGMSIEEVRKIEDAMAQRVADLAEQDEERQDG